MSSIYPSLSLYIMSSAYSYPTFSNETPIIAVKSQYPKSVVVVKAPKLNAYYVRLLSPFNSSINIGSEVLKNMTPVSGNASSITSKDT